MLLDLQMALMLGVVGVMFGIIELLYALTARQERRKGQEGPNDLFRRPPVVGAGE
jgi:hypothetical protein